MAQNINSQFIERYQMLYQKDPRSKVFAPLGEAYRKLGMINEALDVLSNGVKNHPNFPSGRVALAKVLIEKQNFEEAIKHLVVAVEYSPENILAHRLLAECYIKLRQPKAALKAYKMALFLNPNDASAKDFIQKIESITADEFEEDVFEMKPIIEKEYYSSQALSPVIEEKISSFAGAPNPVLKERQLERVLSLVDAFIARGNLGRASEVLTQGEEKLGSTPEILKRKKFIQSRLYQDIDEIEEPIAPEKKDNSLIYKKKIDLLERLLQRIEDRRLV